MKIIKLTESIEETLEPEVLEEAALTEEEDLAVRETDGGAKVEVDVAVTDTDETALPASTKDSLRIQNALTDVLDRALEDARYALDEDNLDANCNVLVTGLPGSSKTATIRNWCKLNGCHLHYLDAKNPDLQLLTSGGSAIDRTDPAHPKMRQAFSDALRPLERENSVLFLDELNRQVKEYMRGSLLTLLADRRVAGEDEEGFKYFPNLLFTIAAVNPPKEGDRGASELNDAEKRRFYYSVEFNSEVPTTKVFFKEYYDKKIEAFAKKQKGEFSAAAIERINSFCLRQWIGTKIILDDDFHYTQMDEYLSKTEKGQITCQSTITELIDHSRGDLDRLIHDINAGGLTASAKEMLIKIIKRLVLPNIDALRAKKAEELGIDLGSTVAPLAEPAAVEDDDDAVTPDDFLMGREDDDSFSDDGSSTSSARIDPAKVKEARVSEAEIMSRISSYVSKWG
jgi:hypothetical protein